MDEKTYKIIRMYCDFKKATETIKTGLTEEEAQEHCSREDTHEKGVWFDGYIEE